MEVSEYKSVLALFEEKVCRRPLEELWEEVRQRAGTEKALEYLPTVIAEEKFGTPIIYPQEPFNLSAEVGKALESVVGKYVSTHLGLPVYKDTKLYSHPHYPWLLVALGGMEM